MEEQSDIIQDIRKFPGIAGVIELSRQGKFDEVDSIVALGEGLKKRLFQLRDKYLNETDLASQISFVKEYFTLKYENDDIIFIFYLAGSKEEFNKLLGLFEHSYNYEQLLRQFSTGLDKDISFEELKKLMF